MFGGKRKPAPRPAQDRGQARGGGKSLTQVTEEAILLFIV